MAVTPGSSIVPWKKPPTSALLRYTGSAGTTTGGARPSPAASAARGRVGGWFDKQKSSFRLAPPTGGRVDNVAQKVGKHQIPKTKFGWAKGLSFLGGGLVGGMAGNDIGQGVAGLTGWNRNATSGAFAVGGAGAGAALSAHPLGRVALGSYALGSGINSAFGISDWLANKIVPDVEYEAGVQVYPTAPSKGAPPVLTAPSRKPYSEVAGGYRPDTNYAAALAGAQQHYAKEMAGLEGLRKARLAEIQSRYDLNPNGTDQERQALEDAIKGINGDADRAAGLITRNYDAAKNEATVRYAEADAIAKGIAPKMAEFYNAASASASANVAGAMTGAGASGTVGTQGLGGTVVSGAATGVSSQIVNDGLREAANAGVEAGVMRNNLAYLRDSAANESADQSRDVYRVAQDYSAEARAASAKAIRDRISQEKQAMYGAMDSVTGRFDDRRFTISDTLAGLPLEGAKYEGGRRDAYLSEEREYNAAGAITDHEDEVARINGLNAQNSITAALTGLGAQNGTTGDNTYRSALEITGNPNLTEAGGFLTGPVKAAFMAELQGAMTETDPVKRAIAIQAALGSFAPEQQEYLLAQPGIADLIYGTAPRPQYTM